MKLIIISGRSGSGKSTALNALEDQGFNCIDNFPVGLLQSLVHNTLRNPLVRAQNMAVCIDARATDLERFPEILLSLDRMDLDCQVIFLDARNETLVKRFSETRRRHPLTSSTTDLNEAIETERELLESISDLADLLIDTTQMDSGALREMISVRVATNQDHGVALLFRSFGFKYGVPVDADFVFDIRCLPNPHWVAELRPLTGLDEPVASYLQAQPTVGVMFDDIHNFVARWLPRFEDTNRVYLTLAIGCTGGQHRSVYMAETLAKTFKAQRPNVLVRHRELPRLLGTAALPA
ncbi:MAG: RNase adapter RapZ [Pseudomonadota bacterium]